MFISLCNIKIRCWKNQFITTSPVKNQTQFSKNREQVKYQFTYMIKCNRLLDILEQYNIISPVNKEEQPKGNTFINPVIILAKGESLKIVLDARYLNSLIDESKCNWPIEPIQVIFNKNKRQILYNRRYE